MQINRDRIFAAKQRKAAMDVNTILNNKHSEICNNPSSVECAKFLQTFKSQPWNYIAENFNMLISLPIDTTDYAKSMLESYKFDADILTDCKSLIENMINDDNDYVVNLESLLDTVNNQLNYKESLDYLREETHFMFAKSHMKELFVIESNIANELDALIYNVNYDPETISEYEELIRRVKMDNKREYFSDYSDLLRANTEFAKALKHDPPMDVINLITDLPVIMVNKMIDNKCEPHEFKVFKKVLEVEMRYSAKALASGEYAKYRLVKIYMRKFNIAINEANDRISKVKVLEGIPDMQPDIINEDKPASEIYDYDPDYSDIETMITDMVFKEGDLEFEDIEKLSRLENYINTHFEIVEEDIAGKAARAQKVVRKATNGISRPGSKIKRTTTAIKRIPQPFFNMVNRVVNDIKRMDKNERREKIVTGGFRLKISRLITRGIAIIAGGALIKAGLGGAAIIAPLLTLIGIYAMIAKDKSLDSKERRKILNELESELAIVTEKIEDARGSDDKEKKYQLMRTKQKLEQEIERIKHGLDN